MTSLLLFGAGLILLLLGAEWLVRGAKNVALALGISPLIIGLTVVAFGTGAPEFVVSLAASFAGKSDIAFGNVVGSNIANILLVLGLSACLRPLVVDRFLIWRDVPVMIGSAVLVLLLGWSGTLTAFSGLLLLLAGGWYLFHLVSEAIREKVARSSPEKGVRLFDFFLIAAGVVLLVLGSDWLVTSATEIAREFGVSELLIALTLISLGTSLPEVATSLMAVYKGERDLAVGNVVGSCIFNIFIVLGSSAVAAPNGIAIAKEAFHFDLLVLIGASFACLPIFFSDHTIHRWEGVLFLVGYIVYLSLIVLRSV